jgi:hypothetical protein
MAEMEKSGAVPATRATVTTWDRVPLVPVIVRVAPPNVFAPTVVTVNTEIAEPVTEAGLKDAVAFAGNPLTARLTVPANPSNAPTPTRYFAVEPVNV